LDIFLFYKATCLSPLNAGICYINAMLVQSYANALILFTKSHALNQKPL